MCTCGYVYFYWYLTLSTTVILLWFKSCLQAVTVDNNVNTCGVPQGSALRPLLFINIFPVILDLKPRPCPVGMSTVNSDFSRAVLSSKKLFKRDWTEQMVDGGRFIVIIQSFLMLEVDKNSF